MAIAVDPARTFDYVLQCDRELPKEQQTVFQLKVLTAKELAQIEDNAVVIDKEEKIAVNSGSTVLKTLRVGLQAWENFKDANGNPVMFQRKAGIVCYENFDRLRPEWRRELANAITEQTRLTEDQVKNSESGQD